MKSSRYHSNVKNSHFEFNFDLENENYLGHYDYNKHKNTRNNLFSSRINSEEIKNTYSKKITLKNYLNPNKKSSLENFIDFSDKIRTMRLNEDGKIVNFNFNIVTNNGEY